MSDEKTPLLTRGAAYILEGILQELGPCTTPNKIVKWSRLWQLLRTRNDRTVTLESGEKVDFERAVIPTETETNAAFQKRVQERGDAFTVWKDQPFDLVFTDKQRDIAREATKWVLAHQKDTKFKFEQSQHIAVLFEAIGLDDTDDDT